MKLTILNLVPALATLVPILIYQAIRVQADSSRILTFRVGGTGVGCGNGDTTIACSPAPTHSCKGDFGTAEGTLTVLQTVDPFVYDCHISLYPKDGQQGGVLFRVNASGGVGDCVETGPGGLFKSYGVFCDID